MSSPKPSRGIELVSSAVGEVGAVSTTTPELAQSSKKAVKRFGWWASKKLGVGLHGESSAAARPKDVTEMDGHKLFRKGKTSLVGSSTIQKGSSASMV